MLDLFCSKPCQVKLVEMPGSKTFSVGDATHFEEASQFIDDWQLH